MMFFRIRYLLACSSFLIFSLFLNSTVAQELTSQGNLEVDRLGAAVYTLPISAIDGVGGVKPNISAVYNSQAPNGILGKGGSISGLSVIKRCQQTLVRDGQNKAISWTAEDRFCIDSQRLMLVAGTQGLAESQYRTEIDSGVIYTAKGGSAGNPDYFEAIASDGATLIFGGSGNAKELGAATMTWALSQYQDTTKNTIQYIYEGTAADGLRIKRINYAFPIPTTTLSPGAYIEFEYKDRDDPISKYVAGYEFRTNKLLSKINTYGLMGLLYRSYQFDVATSSGLTGYVSRWQSVKECTTLIVCADAIKFEWGTTQVMQGGKTELKDIGFNWIGVVPKHGYSSSSGYIETSSASILAATDLNGDGINDFVWTERGSDDYLSVFTSYDPAVFSYESPRFSRKVAQRLISNEWAYSKTVLGDVNSDGLVDLLIPSFYNNWQTSWTAYETAREVNEWSSNGSQKGISAYPSSDFLKVLDTDGDGYSELISINPENWITSLFKININTKNVESPDYYFPNFKTKMSFTDLSSRGNEYSVGDTYVGLPNGGYPIDVDFTQGDFDGDGATDFAMHTGWWNTLSTSQKFRVRWYSLQASDFLYRGSIIEETRSPISWNSAGKYQQDALGIKELQAPDINGDGISDIAYKKGAQWYYSINTGKIFLPPKEISNGSLRLDRGYFFDVNRDGLIDFVFVSSNSISGKNEIYVKYWNSKLSGFDEAVLLRDTKNYPYILDDFTGDGWLDVIELDELALSKKEDSLKIFGFSNNSLQTPKGGQGVLSQDIISNISIGNNFSYAINSQTLVRPDKKIVENCLLVLSNFTQCQDFSKASQYKALRMDVSFDSKLIDSSSFYSKTNEPFSGLNNLFANEGFARVFQYVAPLPIVTRIKVIQTVNGIQQTSSDKKYFYWVMRTQAGGRGLLGFEKTSIENLLTGEREETEWRQDWPYTGKIINQRFINSAGSLVKDKACVNTAELSGNTSNKYFKLHNKIYEHIFSDSNYSAPSQINIYDDGNLIAPSGSTSQSSGSSASSVTPQLSYPSLELGSPNVLESYKLGQYPELAIIATAYSANGLMLKNSDGTNPKVTFYINGALQTGLRPDPDGRIKWWKPTSAGEFVVEAKTTLESGVVLNSKSGVFKITQDGAPTVKLTNPSPNATVFEGEPVSLSAVASDSDDSIKSVSFFVNGTLIGSTDDTAPYFATWLPTQAGEYSVTAVAIDFTGKKTTTSGTKIRVVSLYPSTGSSSVTSSTSSSASVNVELGSPSLTINEKFGLGAEVALLAAAKTPDGSFWLDNDDHKPKIDFYINNVLATDLRKDNAGPIMWWRPTSAGTYTVKAVAQLGGGRTAESKLATVNVVGRAAPVIKITSPSSIQTFIALGDELTLSASASDADGDLAGIAFYANNFPLSNNLYPNAAPSIKWKPTQLGDYSITAIAIDGTFIKTTSSPIVVTVIDKSTATLSKPIFLNSEGLESPDKDMDTNGAFTLRWSGSVVADYYVLTQGDTEIYKGPEFSKSLQLKLGTYNFKLKACQSTPARCSDEALKTIKVNTANNGAVKNIVDLTIPAPDREQTGSSGQQFGLYAEAKTPTGEVWRAADGTAATMTYYANGIKLNSLTSDSSGALKFTELTQPGSYSITAEAILDDGTKVTSEVGTVIVRSNSSPVINMTSPVNMQRVTEGKSVKLSAQISDNENNIAQVMFLVDGKPIGKATTSTPYEMQWTPPAVGTYSISVRAIDSGGLQSQSAGRSLIVDALTINETPAAFLSPDYSPLGNLTKVLRAENEPGDVLVLTPPNTSGISYNAFTKFVVGQPLKIINVGDNAATLIVVDAQQLTLNNTIEVIGATADVLLINPGANSQIQCHYCNFINVGRVTLAAAQPVIPFSTTMANIGDLNSTGEVSIKTLKAPAARVEVLGKIISTVKNDSAFAINTQQQARLQANNEYVLDSAGDKLVGTGSVNFISGQVKVDYSNFTALDFNTDANTAMTNVEGNIRSGAIKIVAASSLTINSLLSTHSDVRASLLVKDEFKLANERIELTTLDRINGDLINNGVLVSDDKIKLIATGNIRNNSTATVTANHIEAVAAKDLTNLGVFNCPDTVCAPNAPNSSLVTNLYLSAESVIDNQNTISGFTNLTLTAAKDLNNRFGGTIEASNVYLNSKAGSIRNGWATPYENLPEDYWLLRPSSYTQQLSTFDKFILPNIKGSQTPAKKARTKEAYIVGNKIILNAYKHVENINPTLDVYRNGTSTPVEDITSANAVSIIAAKRMEVRAHGYILNSSATMSVDGSDGDSAMLLMAPQVHNERYFMLALGDIVNEQGVVIDKSSTTQSITTTTSTNLESRLYVYSPAGVIFSNAMTMFKFDEAGGITSILNPNIPAAAIKGFENNTSYFIIENDVEFQGAGSLVRSKGVLLERENYYLKRTLVVRDLMCRPLKFGRVAFNCDKSVNTINRNPLGETVQETIERTIFAVSGRLFGTPASFVGINENPLDKAKGLFVEEYKKDVAARFSSDSYLLPGTPYESKLLGMETVLVNGVDGPYIFTSARYQYLHPEHIPVSIEQRPTEIQRTETKSVWDIVTEGFASLKAKFLALLDEFEKGI